MSDSVRKMQLVEVGELERLQQRQVKEYDPTLNAMARARFDLDTILSTKHLTDEDKLALLSNAQLKFKKLKASIGPTVTTDVTVPTPAPTAAPVKDPLQQYLDKYPNVIRSNAAGQLVFKNVSVPDSSYEQILEDANSGGNFDQPGFREFIQGLRMLHPPANVIKNEALQTAYASRPRKSEAFSPSVKAAPSDPEDDKPLATPSTVRKTRKQKGKGSAAPPPGKRPHILFLYK